VITCTVRSFDDARAALDAFCSGAWNNVRLSFENCRIVVDNTDPIDRAISAHVFLELQRTMRRQYCWLKYGKRRVVELTQAEKIATEVGEWRAPDGRSVVYDVTKPLNTLAATVDEWGAMGPPWRNQTRDLFASDPGSGADTWKSIVKGWGDRTLDKVTPTQAAAMATFAILATFVHYTAPILYSQHLEHVSERYEKETNRQERLALAERTTVVTYSGSRAGMGEPQKAALEMSIKNDRAVVRHFISDNIEMPLPRFVVAEAERGMASVLKLVPTGGSASVNGAEINHKAAKEAQRLLKKRKKPKPGEWVTITKRSEDA
jgi:hypothetical protein